MNMIFNIRFSDNYGRWSRFEAGALPGKPVKNFHRMNQPPKGPRKGH
jgi:hypothetical protein